MAATLTLSNTIKSGLIAEIAVVAGLAVWILLRAGALVEKSIGMDPGFFAPRTTLEAIRSGYIIWFIVSFVLSFVAAGIYYLVTTKWHWKPVVFSVLAIGVAVLVSVLAFVAGMDFAVEAAGEMLIVGVGFGVLIPWLAQRRTLKAATVAS